MERQQIGQKLRQVREAHKLSQEELAQKMGLSQKTISSWEKDRTYPKLKELHKLCYFYDCTYEFLTGTKQYDSNDISLDDIMAKLSTLDMMELEKINAYIQTLIKQQKEIISIAREKDRLEMEKRELEEKLADYDRMLDLMKSQGIRRS